MDLGLARNPKPGNLSVLGQSASEKNGNTPDFNELYNRFFSSSPLQQSQIKLEISQPQLGASTFHPSCAYIQSEAVFEIIKKPAAGGFPEYIHQVLTDDNFTLIDLLSPPSSGWRIRVWKRNAATLSKSGGYYVTTGFEATGNTPLTEIVFKRPLGSTSDTTLIWTKKESSGLAGTSISTHEITETLDSSGRPSRIVSTQYAGEDTTGPLLAKEILDIKERGTQAWNYTIERQSFVSSVDAAGTIGDLSLISKTREDYDDFSLTSTGGELGKKRLVSYTKAFDTPGQIPQTTTYTHLNTPSNPLTHGRLESSVKPDGSWTYTEYSTLSPSSPVSTTIEYSGWKDLTMAQRANARRTVTTVEGNTTTVDSYVASRLISRSRTKLLLGAAETITSQESWDGTSTADSAWHKTVTGYYLDTASAPNTGRINWVENSDGTAENYSYATVGGNLVMTVRSGAGSRAGITSGKEAKQTLALGNIPISMVIKDIASNLTVEQWDTDLSYNSGFDRLGRPIKRIYNGDVTDYDISQYACCGLEESRERNGIIRKYFRDGLKRVYKTETQASPNSPVITDFTTVSGLTSTFTRKIGDNLRFLGHSTRSMDNLTHTFTGPSRKSNNAIDRPVTTTVTTHSSTGDTVTVTKADGSTAITSSYLDGRTKTVTGTAVADMSYNYLTHDESGGGERTVVTSSGMSSTSFQDLLGRQFKTIYSASGTSTVSFYPTTAALGSRGKVQSVTDADNVTVTSGYDSEGEQTASSRSIPFGSGTATQVTKTETDVVSGVTLRGISLGVSFRSIQKISSTGVPEITVGESYSSVDGFRSGTRSFGVETVNVVSRPTDAGIAQSISYNPDGTSTVQTSTHGLPSSIQTKSSTGAILKEMTTTYDGLQRPLTVTDLRLGTTTYDVDVDGKPDITEAGQTLAIKNAAGEVLRYEYDKMGRVIKSTLPDLSNAYTAYYPNGQVKVTWGSQTYPTWNVYDEQGRRTQLHTWKVAPILDPAAVPATLPGGSEFTTWIYGPTTGLLDRKQYADNKGTDYTYTAAGRLWTREWARTLPSSTTRVKTTYTYRNGLLTLTDYNDTTPDVTITYDPLGRQESVSTSVAKSEFTYDPATLAIDTETISYNLDNVPGYEFFRVLDRKPTSQGRDTGFDLKTGSTQENQTSYGYGPTDGRLSTVTNGTSTFRYDYFANSSLVEHVTATAGAVHTVTNTWEPTRDVLAAKQNKVGSSDVSKYDYSTVNGGVNKLGQRMGVQTTFNLGGVIVSNAGDTSWGYDSLGQVTSTDHSAGTTSDRAYEYDSIGNRRKTANSLTLPTSDNYATNKVNQYTTIQEGGTGVSPVYDEDGNATAYPLPVAPTTNSTLTWDAENRLISSTSGSVTTTYAYDARSRRIAKTTDSTSTLYVYDSWNCIAEYSGSVGVPPTLQKTRLWGPDLSGTLQGGGGVGGLLAESSLITSNPITFNTSYPTYDGNGNVSEYLNSTGQVIAHFEYDPFGNTVVNSDATNQFAYRFSTKPMDLETRLYYYGYRYFDPATGRWPSRDPIEEAGGLSLYGFVNNTPGSRHDVLGMWFEWLPFLGTIESAIKTGLGKYPGMDAEDYEVSGCPGECENAITKQSLEFIKSFATPNMVRIAIDIGVLALSTFAGLPGLIVGGLAAIDGMANAAVMYWGVSQMKEAADLAKMGCPMRLP